MGTTLSELVPGAIVTGPLLPEPVEVLATMPMGSAIKLLGRGLRTNQVHQPVLDAEQVAQLAVTPKQAPFDGDATRFRLGIEAQRLGLAYEYDPYFSLSIARIDPLPHQLEAVYEYFLKVPRIRFLLADDPGAGKTIMAGLLLKELKTRGLIKRTLIVTPANLTFQWQRELKDKFREPFHVVRGDVLRAGYGSNPWAEHDQVVTSVSWISRVEDARDSLLRTNWDLVIVDEAHKMSPTFADKPTLAYQIGESLSQRTDHFLLMTATPHKGDPDHFRRFLSLLDKDVYADITSLQEAMKKKSAPFYLRRVKEALVSFPDPETGKVKKLFVKRDVQTAAFDLEDDEFTFYRALTDYVTNQSAKAAAEDSPAARALGFTMAMLQRRFASSAFAARRSLERMKERRQRILEDPEKFRKQQIEKALPDDFDELPDEDQQKILTDLENVVVTFDPAQIRTEIQELTALIVEARALERREVESKLKKLREVLKEWGLFDDPKMKLLVFTEHKDTLDYLAGNGKDIKGKLVEWGFRVGQIHGGMPIGDPRDPALGTRLRAERDFKRIDGDQILVATEAAGEGINLQFCWLMVNYDIPWNPVRLEQRMGRIHRYGQERDCVIFNFVAQNTREGRVLEMLLTRLRQIREDLESDKVFDVVGEVFPSNLLEKMFRDLYAGKIGEKDIKDKVLSELDPKRFRQITESTLEGLAKRELNLSAIIGKTAEAKERRLVPEVIEDFAVQAGQVVSMPIKPEKTGSHVYRVGKVPKNLLARGPAHEARFGVLAKEYGRIGFDKGLLKDDPTLEWVTPGHALFEALRADLSERVADDLRRGAVFYDLQTSVAYRLDVFAASIKDGRANVLHRRLFVVRVDDVGFAVRQPTIFLDLTTSKSAKAPDGAGLPDRHESERELHDQALRGWLLTSKTDRDRETVIVRRHVEISLNELIQRAQVKLAEFDEPGAQKDPLYAANRTTAEQHYDELNRRLDDRLQQLDMERLCTIADIDFIGQAWVLPHPDRSRPEIAPMISDPEIERLAVEEAIRYERSLGWEVTSVESENRGYDLLSRKPHPSEPGAYVASRFIEVKGRRDVGEVALSSNEFKTAQRLGGDYWLYVVFNCGSKPDLHTIQDPARLGWKPVVRVEHYHATPATLLGGETKEVRKPGDSEGTR